MLTNNKEYDVKCSKINVNKTNVTKQNRQVLYFFIKYFIDFHLTLTEIFVM